MNTDHIDAITLELEKIDALATMLSDVFRTLGEVCDTPHELTLHPGTFEGFAVVAEVISEKSALVRIAAHEMQDALKGEEEGAA